MEEIRIQTLKLDTSISNGSLRKKIEDKLLGIFNNETLTKEIATVFETFFKGKDVEIEKIELVLPEINVEMLTKDYLFHVREQLILFLEDYCKNRSFEEKVEMEKSSLDNIFHFLKNGYFYWNYDKKETFSVLWINQLKSIKFKDYVFKYFWKEYMVKRLVYQLKDSDIIQTINFLHPNDGKSIVKYHEALISISNKGISMKDNISEIKEIIFQFTMIFILLKSGVGFNKKQFFLWHLSKLSSHYNVPINHLLTILKKALSEKLIKERYSELLEIILELTLDIGEDSLLTIEEVEQILTNFNKTQSEISALKRWILNSPLIIQKNWINNNKYEYLSLGLEILIPSYAKNIIKYQERLIIEVLKKSVSSQSSVKKAIWTFTYIYVSQPFESFFNLKNFVSYHIEKTANQYGLSVSYLLDILLYYFEELSKVNTQFDLLYTVLETLSNTKKKEGSTKVLFSNIIEYLKSENITNTQKQTVKIWISDRKNYKLFLKNIIVKLDIAVINKMLEVVEPKHLDFIIKYVSLVSKRFHQKPLGDRSNEAFTKDIYIILFDYLLFQSSSTNFNIKMMLKKQLESLAKKYNTSFELFLEYLLMSGAIENEITLFTTLLSLRKEEQLSAKNYDDKQVYNYENLIKLLTQGENKTILTDNNLEHYFLYVMKYRLNDFILFLFRKKINFNLLGVIFNKFKQNDKSKINLFVKTYKSLQKLGYGIASLEDLNFVYFIFYLKNKVVPFSYDIKAIMPLKLSKRELTFITNLDHLTIVEKWVELSDDFKINCLLNESKKANSLYIFLSVFKRILGLTKLDEHDFEKYFWLSFFESLKVSISKNSFFYDLITNFKSSLIVYGIDKVFFDKTLKKIDIVIVENTKIDNVDKVENELLEIEEEKLFVKHSGLVLLYPLIPHLFHLLGYHNPHETTSENRIRAVYILAYAATGKQEHEEHDLVLEKILCGLPVYKPLPKITLNEDELEKTEILLEQLILQWNVLKNTSIHGLRNTFILREGILIKQEENYNLNVEEKGFDVLMDSYPWSLSIVKFAWMDFPIHVNWRK